MLAIQPINLESYQGLAKIQKEIIKMNKKIKDWLLYLCCILDIISYFVFALTSEYKYISITCAIIFILLLILCTFLGMRKFDQVIAKSFIQNPSTLYDKYCVQICVWAELINEQIVDYNSMLMNQTPGIARVDMLEFATLLEAKKRQLEADLNKLYRTRFDIDPDTLRLWIAEIEDKIRLDQQIRAITIE